MSLLPLELKIGKFRVSLRSESVDFFYHVLYCLIFHHVHRKIPGKIEKNQESGIQFIDTKGEKNFKNRTLTNEAEVNKTAVKSLQLANKSLAIFNTN